jgi:hypothetical protein
VPGNSLYVNIPSALAITRPRTDGSADLNGTGLINGTVQVHARDMCDVIVNAGERAQVWAAASADVEQVGTGLVESYPTD